MISLFDPLETGLASGKASEISFIKKSRIFFDCEEEANPPFGRQRISFSEQTIGDRFGERGQEITIKDKYAFSEGIIEGKKLYYFSKPLFMGFKVSDLLMLYSDSYFYCFYDAPEDFQDDIENLQLQNIFFPNKSETCLGVNVCFSSLSSPRKNCDINVFENERYVSKNGKRLYYENDLIYGAIFSSPGMYECNVKRIKNRYNELAKIYLEKTKVLERFECQTQLSLQLARSINYTISNSKELNGLFSIVDEIEFINKGASDSCKLYRSF